MRFELSWVRLSSSPLPVRPDPPSSSLTTLPKNRDHGRPRGRSRWPALPLRTSLIGTVSCGASGAYGPSAMPANVLRVADRVAGNAIERLTNDHHARRLGKLGRFAQRTPPDDGRLWAAGDPPPRPGNALDVLIGGAAYFPALEQAIRCARRSVLIAGWCVTPEFALVRDEPPVLLRELLGEAAESVAVRVLLWAGAPVPVFAPRRASVREGRDELVRGTRIKTGLDSNERPLHCHHEK